MAEKPSWLYFVFSHVSRAYPLTLKDTGNLLLASIFLALDPFSAALLSPFKPVPSTHPRTPSSVKKIRYKKTDHFKYKHTFCAVYFVESYSSATTFEKPEALFCSNFLSNKTKRQTKRRAKVPSSGRIRTAMEVSVRSSAASVWLDL